jgi:beta-xylosidase
LNLNNGKSAYGRGSWASSLRYHQGTYYVSTFSQTTGRTNIYTTKNIEEGPWNVSSFHPSFHDHTLWFEQDGRVYLIYGVRQLKLVELSADLSGIKPGSKEQIIIEDASAPAKADIMLGAEGSQLFKAYDKYYLFNITWPRNGMRTVIVHRADKITGPWEGRLALQDLGVAQGGLVDTPQGQWFAYLFRDYGAVGRIPYLVQVKWEEGWPVLGLNGKVPETLSLPVKRSPIQSIVQSDEFARKKGEPPLPLAWQWNHNPDSQHWSIAHRSGYLRLTTSRIDTAFHLVKNILTQRTIGPWCAGSTMLDVTNMNEGDFAGLALFQQKYGQVGVRHEGGKKYIVMISAETEPPIEMERITLDQGTVHLKAECDFGEMTDVAEFYYSLDGNSWKRIGGKLKMSYTIPHFMGYRYALFNYSSKKAGGYVDFDFFRISDKKAK